MKQAGPNQRTFIRPAAAPPAVMHAPSVSTPAPSATCSPAPAAQHSIETRVRNLSQRIPHRVPQGLRSVAEVGCKILLWWYYYLVEWNKVLVFCTSWANWLLPYASPRTTTERAVRGSMRLLLVWALLCVIGLACNTMYDQSSDPLAAHQLASRRNACRQQASKLLSNTTAVSDLPDPETDPQEVVWLLRINLSQYQALAEALNATIERYHAALVSIRQQAIDADHQQVAEEIRKRIFRLEGVRMAMRAHSTSVPRQLNDLARLNGLLEFSHGHHSNDSTRQQLRFLTTEYHLLRDALRMMVDLSNPTPLERKNDEHSTNLVSDRI